ncbi:hypothetical protein P4J60_30255 [Bacillus cereus]|nr:hypothetical protein [Bacillus cereus]MEB9571438.1 hypothetical protein [Bacillus cereus]
MRVVHSLLAMLAVIFLICGVIIHEYVLVFLVGICCMVIGDSEFYNFWYTLLERE